MTITHFVCQRKRGERIIVDGPCEIVIHKTGPIRAKIGVRADSSVGIRRAELDTDDTDLILGEDDGE